MEQPWEKDIESLSCGLWPIIEQLKMMAFYAEKASQSCEKTLDLFTRILEDDLIPKLQELDKAADRLTTSPWIKKKEPQTAGKQN